MKSRETHYESDSSVRSVLHRDTQGHILSSLDFSDAFRALQEEPGLWRESLGVDVSLCGYTLAVHIRLDRIR